MSADTATFHEFGTAGLTARVLAKGAELCQLRDHTGRDYVWSAGPAWPRHAPNLFPIVGRLPDDTLTHEGRAYRVTQHGFARDMGFAWVERSATGCTLALTDTAETREKYPFAFRFLLGYAAEGNTLRITFAVENPGETTLPASMGAHPAFCWPLVPGTPKEQYALEFDQAEPDPLRMVAGGLLVPEPRPTPIVGKTLALTDAIFAQDALILPAPRSRSLRYGAADGPALTIAWDGWEQLGIWSKPGAEFVCVEPWCGMATPVGFAGEFSEKPWLMLIPPGGRREATMSVSIAG
jgi:galactose mutarotase-like enzyme